MSLRRVALILPTDQLADLGLDYQAEDAANLLTLWTLAWHPALIVATGALPTTRAVDSLVDGVDLDGELVLVPDVTWADDVATWRQGLDESEQRRVPDLRGVVDRRSAWNAIADGLAGNLPDAAIPLDTADEFYALGFAYFQVEMLTRVMRYQPISAESDFTASVVAAATCALEGQPLDEPLAAIYDQLTQSRSHYYPVDFHLVDLTLTADSVIDEPLQESCQATHAVNLLMTGELADTVAEGHPATATRLREAVSNGRVELVGGSHRGGDLSRHSPESLLADFRQGLQSLTKLAAAPRALANFSGVVTPLVPQLAQQLGFAGVVVTNLDGRPLPPLYPPRCCWQGIDGTSVEALVTAPLDRGDSGTMLRLAEQLSQAMDNDLVATLVLAGWPGASDVFFRDLCRVAARSEVLGRFVGLGEFFATTTAADQIETLEPRYYRAPLGQEQPDDGRVPLTENGLFAIANAGSPDRRPIDWAGLFGLEAVEPDAADGWLFINTTSQARCEFGNRNATKPVAAWGFAWEPANPSQPPVPLATDSGLQNELVELEFDDMTGGVRSLRVHAARGTQLSQKLTVRGGEAAGVQVAFDGTSLVENSELAARWTSQHRLVSRDGSTLASLEQTTSVVRRTADVRVEWAIQRVAEQMPTGVTIASRIAWRDFAATLRRGCQGVSLTHSGTRIEPSNWLLIEGNPVSVSLELDRALPHRRAADNQLETILPTPTDDVRLNVATRFRLRHHYPVVGAAPSLLAIAVRGRPQQVSGCWLHVSKPQVAVTAIEPLIERECPTICLRMLETSGRPCDCRVELWAPVSNAWRTEFAGGPDNRDDLPVDQGATVVALGPYEWTQVELELPDGGACP